MTKKDENTKTLSENVTDLAKSAADTAVSVVNSSKKVATKVGTSVINAIDENGNGEIDIEDIIIKGLKTPGIRINRKDFLQREFAKRYPQNVIDDAVAHNPLHAKIPEKDIDAIADDVIQHERYFVSGISAALGTPGGFSMVATLPADIIQYYGYLLRAIQELLYLYGFPEIGVSDKTVQFDSETMNMFILCFGTMYGVAGASNAVKMVSKALATGVEKQLLNKALTKGTIYPIVKSVAKWFSVHMTKDVFAGFFKKIIPVVGGAVGGGITYLSFKPCCDKLKHSLQHTMLSDPNYKSTDDESIVDLEIDNKKQTIDLADFGAKASKVTGEGLEMAKSGIRKAGAFLGNTMKNMKEKTPNFRKGVIVFPEDCKALDKKLTGNMPKNAVSYVIDEENFYGVMLTVPVTKESAITQDDTQAVIKSMHETMDDSTGLIEVKNGVTSANHPYVYILTKRHNKEENISTGTEYCINMNIFYDDSIQFINASFKEQGVTGIRDSVVFNILQNHGLISSDRKGWVKDPYDENYHKGFLMNLSEVEFYDKLYPDHPLSAARTFIRDIIQLN